MPLYASNPVTNPLVKGVTANSLASVPATGATWIWFGDSVIQGYNATTKSAYKTLTPNPTGTSFASLISAHYNGSEYNLGVAGAALVQKAGEAAASAMTRYVADLIPQITPTCYLVENHGFNDVSAGSSLVTYKANLLTIYNACLNAGLLPSHLYVLNAAYCDPAFSGTNRATLENINGIRADVCQQIGAVWVSTDEAMARNGGSNWLSTYIYYGTAGVSPGVHLTDAGSAAVANSIINDAEFLVGNIERDRRYAKSASVLPELPQIIRTPTFQLSQSLYNTDTAFPVYSSFSIDKTSGTNTFAVKGINNTAFGLTTGTSTRLVAGDVSGNFGFSGSLTSGGLTLQDPTDNTKQASFNMATVATATTRTFTFPNVTGTLITTGDIGTVSNTMLAGSIAPSKLSAFTGLAIGGPLTTATSGSFSGAVTTGRISAGTDPGIGAGDISMARSTTTGVLFVGNISTYLDYGVSTVGAWSFSNGGLRISSLTSSGVIIAGNGAGSAGTAGFYSGTGVPSFSAPSGSVYLRYDGTSNNRHYINTSTASSSGTTWSSMSTL